MKSCFAFIILLLLSATAAVCQCTLPAPTGLKSKNIQSCQFGLKWKIVPSALDYAIQYKKSEDTNWITISSTGNANAYTLESLEAATSYDARVAGICGTMETGSFTATQTISTLICSEPTGVAAGEITSSSARISWSVICDAPKFSVRFRQAGTSEWATVKNIKSTSFILGGLNSGTAYEVKAESKCEDGDSEYSPSIFFTTLSSKVGKNILLVIVDDARFDTYQANGGPSFFNDQHISGIAEQGANFTQAFAASSMCAPSRGSIMTGLYPHLHGITDNPLNNVNLTISNVTFPQVLHDHGYFTGLIGKYHISSLPQPGFDYWMEGHTKNHFNAKFNVNGSPQIIPGHITDAVTDSAIAFLSKVPDGKPFFLWLGYRAPHEPPVPRIEEEGIFDTVAMPFPDNFYRYEADIPEFSYKCHSYGDTVSITDYYRGYFELLQGVETRLGDVIDTLTESGLLDSTLIIFMSDNGYMLGEHLLREKRLPYEESIRIPLFMRYPPKIPAGTVVSDQIALNIDIASTLLDLAEINDTFGFQGVSLLDMINHEAERDQMLYQFYNKECVPDLRGVRDFEYKYVTYHCTETTEELFDLMNDPKENLNLISNPEYAAVAEEYRDRLAFMRASLQDFSWDSLYECSLTNPERIQHGGMPTTALLNCFPNPASDGMIIHYLSEINDIGSVRIVNAYGAQVYSESMHEPFDKFLLPIDISHWPAGNYFVHFTHGSYHYSHSFTVQR